MKEIRDLKIFLGGKTLIVNDVKALGFFGKFKGLMFSNKDSSSLIFNNAQNRGIHSFFVFYRFLCVWLDSNNNVLDYKIVKPFRFYVITNKKFSKILEIPINSENKKILNNFKKL